MTQLKNHLKAIPKEQTEFLRESNAIERVYDDESLVQAQCAWTYLMSSGEMTPHVVEHTHLILMANQKLLQSEKGNYRQVPVYIGGKAAINWVSIPLRIEDWCIDMNMPQAEENTVDGKERYSKMLHVEYERIHPFVDGNGRTGRMFMNWWRMKNGLPVLVIHEGEEQMDYYQWFKDSQDRK